MLDTNTNNVWNNNGDDGLDIPYVETELSLETTVSSNDPENSCDVDLVSEEVLSRYTHEL